MIASSHSDFAGGAQPLAGVRVVEFCNVASGPYCCLLLADMGCEVIKIEPKSGDMLRQWPPHAEGYSENFASLNRGKKSIALDLKNKADLQIAKDLARVADVAVENNRPGVMSRLGLDYQTLSADNANLIYCSISAYGQTGPRAEEGGFDVTMQAASGIMSITGEPGGSPVKCGVPISDFTAGLYGAFAISSLLARVRSGGVGGHIDVSMLGTSIAIAALQTSEFFGTGKNPAPFGSAHPRNAPYRGFRAKDRDFVIAAGNDRLWELVCDVVQLPALLKDPRFGSVADRARNQEELTQILDMVFRCHDVAYWSARFTSAGVPFSIIKKYSEVLQDGQVEAMGWVVPLTLPNGVATRTFGSPLRVNGLMPPIRSSPPELDGDRKDILAMIEPAEI